MREYPWRQVRQMVELKQAPHPVEQGWQARFCLLRKLPMLQAEQVGWLPVRVFWLRVQTLQAAGHSTQNPLARTKPAKQLMHIGLAPELAWTQVPQFSPQVELVLIWLQTPAVLSEYPEGQEVQKVDELQVMQGNAQLVQVLLAVLRLAPAKQAVQLLG